jgi:xanthine dehydrogenase YagT iron-sulfur-binding subunit
MDEDTPKFTRREVLIAGASLTAVNLAVPGTAQAAAGTLLMPGDTGLTLQVNGEAHHVLVDSRSTLLDTLRERLALFGTKKGCDHGQCGACTVHVGGRRVLSCLMLAKQAEGKEVTTIEGVAGEEGTLHPVQQAFLDHDALQCGYCTPGQIMSAIACIREGHATSSEEIREYMSGNLCRCGAYAGIVAAIQQAATT